MSQPQDVTTLSKSIQYFEYLNKIYYICGYSNFWINSLNWSKRLIKIINTINICNHVLIGYFVISLFISFETQNNLTQSQIADRNTVAYSNPVQQFYFLTLVFYKDQIRETLFTLIVGLRKEHNNAHVEEEFIKKIKLYLYAFSISGVGLLVFRGMVSLVRLRLYDEPFAPFIAAWPTTDDRSTLATLLNIFNYYLVWLNMSRAVSAYSIIGTLFIAISHQYKNLCSYFLSLTELFEGRMALEEKERRFKEAFEKGIRDYQVTLQCVDQCKHMFRWILGVQMVLSLRNIGGLLPLVQDTGVTGVINTLPLLLPVLFVLGYFMWNAGDITFAASCLPNAVYSSGWQNCHGNNVVIRQLVVNTISRAQEPVIFKAFNIIELSYNTYVTILKTAYSVVSVFC